MGKYGTSRTKRLTLQKPSQGLGGGMGSLSISSRPSQVHRRAQPPIGRMAAACATEPSWSTKPKTKLCRGER